MTLKAPQQAGRYAALDGMRGLCALFVVAFHLKTTGLLTSTSFARNSYLFVDFFFVLSGFVITFACAPSLGAGWSSLRQFLARRVRRLWPLHLFVLALFLLYELAWALVLAPNLDGARPAFAGETSLPNLFGTALLLKGIGVTPDESWNYPTWSIGAEFFTYVIFGLLFVHAKRARHALVGALVVGAAAACLWVGGDSIKNVVDVGIFRSVYGFGLGSLVAAAVALTDRRLGTLPELAAATAAVLFVSAAVGPMTFAAPLLFAVVVAVFALGQGRLSAMLRSGPMQRLGEWSYSIYLNHVFVILLIANALSLVERTTAVRMTTRIGDAEHFGTSTLGGDALALGAIAAVLVMSRMTYMLVERRFYPPRAKLPVGAP